MNTPGKNANQRWYTHISRLTQFMPPPETYKKSEIGSQPTLLCQVLTSHYSRLKNRQYRLPPEKDYHIDYILHVRSTYHYAYARQTRVNWKKETQKRPEDKGKRRKDKKAKKTKKERTEKRRQEKKEKIRREEAPRRKGKRKNCNSSRP